MKNLPIGIQTFSDLIAGEYLYIDKTEYIYRLIAGGGRYYFLSRPRRFGKSLMISTLKEVFSGNKELFRGLWIYDQIDWKSYPVIHIDFLGLNYGTKEELIETLNFLIDKNAELYGITLQKKSYDKRFQELVTGLSHKGKVVVLVDEYDKPIIDFIDQEETALRNRDILKGFYSNLKGLDEYIQFVFITGVSKFSKVSVFSDLNNLMDITIDETYAAMLGYTHEEMLGYFDDRLAQLPTGTDADRMEWEGDIKKWYNGYSWDGKQFVYNPFSVLNFFRKKQFGNYWFESGTPTLMIKLIKTFNIDIEQLEHYRAGESVFSSFEIGRLHVVSLMFQTGYLTIKKVEQADKHKRIYTLSYPNIEVKESFLEYLLGDFSARFADEITVVVEQLKKSLETGNGETFFETMKSVFARIPYDMFVKEREGYYQTVIYLVLMLIGISIRTEVETNQGRIDAVIETAHFIYVMEFKLGTADEALNQIREKQYYQQFSNSSKTVTLIGAGFDIEKRNIGSYKIESI